MPKFRTILELTTKAKTQAEANEIAVGAAEHLLETFNDDGSIAKRIYCASGAPVNVIVPADLLQKLIDGADFGQDQKDYDAERLNDDGEKDTARDLKQGAREWRKAVRSGLALLRKA